MFGHQDDVIKQDQKSDAAVPLPDAALSALTSPPATTPPTDSPVQPASPPAVTTADNSPAPNFYLDQKSDEGVTLDESAPSADPNPGILDESLVTKADPPKASPVAVHTNDLLDIKHEALHDLSPLVDKLDLSGEEKFKTIMMLIQASDEQALIPQAYELAKNISDEKARAQALLDVVNEINYFTQKDSSKE
jgi:hypothetical protein